MRAHLVTAGIIAVVALAALWMKSCAEADSALRVAHTYDLDDAPVERAAWLTLSAQQPAPGSAAAVATAELVQLEQDIDRGALGSAGLGAAGFGSGGHPLVRLPAGATPTPQALALADGPDRGAGAVMTALLIAWLVLAFAWAWRGHDRCGRPVRGRLALASACALMWAGWLVAAAAV